MILPRLVLVFEIACCVVLLLVVARVVRDVWWKPWRIYKRLRAQGVRGPPFIPFVGNKLEFIRLVKEAGLKRIQLSSHGIAPIVFPHYDQWSKRYGETFMFTSDSKVHLTIADPELIKQVLNNKFGYFSKSPRESFSKDLTGDSLVAADGEEWAQKRRILNPGFHVDRLKGMLRTMSELATKMLNSWDVKLMEEGRRSKLCGNTEAVEIDVTEEYKTLTADVIAHTAFGTSYEEGKSVLELQNRQVKMILEARNSISYPGISMLPTRKNLLRWKIRRTIETNLRQLVERRLQQNEKQDNDLLDIMIRAYRGELEGNKKHLRMNMQDIIDECKTFFFAGHETTRTLLVWTTMLLALYSEWQEKVRAEVISVCGNDHPTIDMLNRLKLLTMVLNETLRLYCVVPLLRRCAHEDIKLEKLVIPKGTILDILLIVTMHNKQVWGEDADDFNPNRFSEGISKASNHPMAFMPFSIGPRTCIGQAFAMTEAKVIVCQLLQKFSFELSPTYVHSISPRGIVLPNYGMPIVIKPLLR